MGLSREVSFWIIGVRNILSKGGLNMSINFPYDFRSGDDKLKDEAYEDHMNGDCNGPSLSDKDYYYCKWCEEDREKEQWEDKVKEINKAATEKLDWFKLAIHIVGPLGKSTCPKCGGEGEKCGSWDDGPFYWKCEDCNHQWGHA